jgi:hypothetical protein
MKLIKRFFTILLILFLCFSLISVVVGFIYKDDVKQIVLDNLNDQFSTPISFQEIEISLFQHFPKTSIGIKDVLVLSPDAKKDTLAFFDELNFACNPFSFLSSKYDVSLISISDGFISMTEKVKWNKIYQGAENKSDDRLNVAIEKILFNNILVNYRNKTKELTLIAKINDVSLKGNFSSSQFDLISVGDIYLKNFEANNVKYIQDKNIKLNTSISVNLSEGVWQFNPSNLHYGNLFLSLSGKFVESQNGILCNVNAKGNQWEIQQVMKDLVWLPDYKIEWDWKGYTNANATLTGVWGAKSNPIVVVDVSWKDGSWEWDKYNWKLENIQLKGQYTNATKSGVDKIKIDHFSAENKTSKLSIQGAIARLKDPFFNIWGTNEIDLKLLAPWIDAVGISDIYGTANVQFKTKGKAKNSILHWTDFFGVDSEILVSLENAGCKTDDLLIKDLQGEVFQVGNKATLTNLTGNVNGSDIVINGLVKNWVGWEKATKNILKIELVADVGNVMMESLIKPTEQTSEFELPDNISASVKLNVMDFQWEQFSASKLSGLVQYSNKKFSTTGFKFNHAGGIVITTTTLDRSNNNWHVSSNTGLKQIEVQEFFSQWNNFGQTFIQSNQINGIANAQSLIECRFNKEGVDVNSLYSLTNFSIKNGSLINNQALIGIGDYLKSNLILKAFVKVSELSEGLKKLHFSELNNLIEIKDGTIIIPEMEIKTNALSLRVSGMHSFNQSIDYKFNFMLDDVLRRGKKKDTEDGVTEGGKRIFLKATGTVGNSSFGLDRASARSFKKQEEETEVSQVSDNRFGETTKLDTTEAVTFDWEKKTTIKKDTVVKSDSSKTLLGKLLKKMEKKDKIDEEVEWEIEFPEQD